MERNIPVTQPFLPPLEELLPHLQKIWDAKWLTNAGPLHQQLEKQLAEYLGVPYLSLFSNGTIALMVALRALKIQGEVITTPYSFVATTHSLLWNNITPVFADIDTTTCNLDPEKIEAAITPETRAIMPVHCYGTPCDVERINDIAKRYGLKVIYDAAHAFAVDYKGQSLLNHGDLSILSFHATKVFNTIEGGAIICQDAETKQYIDHLKNFGFVDETVVVATGINGKMNEIQAAFGLLQLEHIATALEKRKQIADLYRKRLEAIPGVTPVPQHPEASSNNSYFPVLIDHPYPRTRDQLYQHLRENKILSRRYFYPLISEFPMYKDLPSSAAENLPVAHSIANRILCLPIYPNLTLSEANHIIDLVAS